MDYLKERSLCSKRLFSWTALATGCPLESGLKDGLLAFDMTWKSATIYGSGNERFPCSTSRGVGDAMTLLLKGLQEGRGREEYLYRSEFMTSQNEILAAIESTEGKSWNIIEAEVDECFREGDMRMKKGFFDGAMMLLERNVLYGEVESTDRWERSEILENRDARLKQAIKAVIGQVEMNGKLDCGCA